MSIPDKVWDFATGEILLVDKPLDWTSFDVIRRIRSLFQIRKVGHAGTLDPKATGLLIVCTGGMTKQISTFMGADKEYVGEFQVGMRTPSFDLETAPTEFRSWAHVTTDNLRAAAQRLSGRQLQMPPMYSATKVAGKPLYRYARKGRTIDRAQKEIVVSEFELGPIELPKVGFRICCGKGTYIRSLVDDLGQLIECGATVTRLRRTRIGTYLVENAMTLPELSELSAKIGRGGMEHYAGSTAVV